MPRRFPVAVIAVLAFAGAPAAHACGSSGYSYAGVTSRDRVHGVGAAITALASPAVQNGHVAGWVGVGGPGLGPHGTSEWIQVGYSGFPGLAIGSLYYEVALPGRNPTYHELLSAVPAGATHRLAVLEMAHHPGWWRVWVDGRRASKPYWLPASHGAWRGVATAESWGGGMRACNKYAYRFRRVVVAGHAGGSWHSMNAAYRMHQGDNHLVGGSPSNFVVRTTTLPAAPQPRLAAATSRPAAPKPAAPPAPAPTPAPVLTPDALPIDPAPSDAATTAPPVDAAPAPPADDADAPAVGATP
ncbi:MAG: hypothetical protein ACJ76I_06720 [Gaiellaceae bacterium]